MYYKTKKEVSKCTVHIIAVGTTGVGIITGVGTTITTGVGIITGAGTTITTGVGIITGAGTTIATGAGTTTGVATDVAAEEDVFNFSKMLKC